MESYKRDIEGLHGLIGRKIDWLEYHGHPTKPGRRLSLGTVEKALDSFIKLNAKMMDWHAAAVRCTQNIQRHGYHNEYQLQRRCHDDSLTVQQRQELEDELGEVPPPRGIKRVSMSS